jgi:3-deoxy-D-manno-octulosonate 8-phosphate phosphatase (KDO 8-P phosphatase)
VIKLIVLDVDGCLTDGRITYSNDGHETKSFDVKDGLAIRSWVNMGYHVAIITGRDSQIVSMRAKELGIDELHQGVKDKKTVLTLIAQSLQLQPYEIAAIGDDLNDYKMLQWVTHSYTPSDGNHFVQDMVATVLTCKGGSGAVREMIEDIVMKNDEMERFLGLWLE